MLASRPEELRTVFTEIVAKKTSVRMVEQLVRRIAQDKIRRHNKTPEMMELEKSLTEKLGTRVVIENRTNGGRVLIEFFSPEDLSNIVSSIAAQQEALAREMLVASVADEAKKDAEREMELHQEAAPILPPFTSPVFSAEPEAVSKEQVEAAAEAEDLYSVRNFSI
jgi:hypothetical protein